MKPFTTLASFQRSTTVKSALLAIQAILKNPKRHLRGPRFSPNPGSGKLRVNDKNREIKTAVSACANGLIDVVSVGGRKGRTARAVREHLQSVSQQKYPDLRSYATVSDTKGYGAYKKLLAAALKTAEG